MKFQHLFPIALFAVFAGQVHAAAPVVSNVTFAQRTGTHLVEITYDVIADTPTVAVWLEISSDGGTTFSVPATTVGGAIGAGVAIGTGKTMTWDAGADWSGQYSAQMRFKVTASDRPPPLPTEFSLIPAGVFQMGDQSNPLVGGNSELPVHTVQVSAFYMGKYEVTKEEWDAVRVWGFNNGYTDLPAGGGKAANHPVHSITWYDMVKWCNARSEKDGLRPCYTVSGSIYKTGSNGAVECDWNVSGYRLPTEAEWEKAARGGVSGKNFPWGGDTISHSQANYYSSALTAYDVSPTRNHHPTYAVSNKPYSSPVGSFAPNGYGLYDMAGNMWEWCWDWYGSYSAGSQTDPRGASSGSSRVYRGGSWGNGAANARCSFRIATDPTYSNPSWVGFRPARSLVP
ncbi:MAG: formylglycine-generating enzyme family protein [Akkermansiaceae bacterium]|nr:formylglycine-generating enzyme family protein [Akkermansiaceae bacterium]